MPISMQEKECKPITKEFIEEFLMEAQSHSGLPFANQISLYYAEALSRINAPDDLLDDIMNEFVNAYMKVSHEVYMRTKTWKSYDW